MQKFTVFIFVTLIIAAIIVGSLIINDAAKKGADFLQSIQTTNDEPPVILNESNTNSGKDSLTYVIDDASSSEAITEPAIADTLINQH